MLRFNKKTKREYALDLFLLLTFLFLMYFALNKLGIVLQDGYTKEFIQSVGIFAPIVFAVVYFLTLLFAPVPGMPVVVTGIGLFGVVNALLIAYAVDFLSAIVNFYIARRFGRGVLQRLVGEKGLRKIDGHVLEFGTEMLILSRLFESVFFEWISYAAGLTKIDFKKYFIISLLGSIPERSILLFLALNVSDLGQMFVQLSFLNYILMAMPFLYYFIKKVVLRKPVVVGN